METPTPPAPAVKTNVLSLISLIAGAVAFLGICVAVFLPIVGPICVGLLAIGALVTGFIGVGQVGKTAEKGKGLAIAGLVLGGLSLLSACLVGFAPLLLGPVIGNVFSEINNSLVTY